MWKIRNGRNQESSVPATIVLIRGPCGDAVDAAVRLSAFSFTQFIIPIIPEIVKPRDQNVGLGFVLGLGLGLGLGFGLGTLWPRPQAFGLGLDLIAFSYGWNLVSLTFGI